MASPPPAEGKKKKGGFFDAKLAGVPVYLWTGGALVVVYLYRKTQGNATATDPASSIYAGTGAYGTTADYGNYGAPGAGAYSSDWYGSPLVGVSPAGPTTPTSTSGATTTPTTAAQNARQKRQDAREVRQNNRETRQNKRAAAVARRPAPHPMPHAPDTNRPALSRAQKVKILRSTPKGRRILEGKG